MVDEISPIVYKKIEISKFTSKMSNLDDSNSEDSLFYDKITKKIIQVSSDGIRIFNKTATKLLKHLNIKLNKEKIYRIAIDKKINYMLILLEKSGEKIILVINIKLEAVLKIINENINNLLGMFFIFNSQTIELDELEESFFTLIYCNKIQYYKIDKNEYNVNYENISLFDEIRFSNVNDHIYKYCYNPMYMILCIEKIQNIKNDLYFYFYNLSNKKFFKEVHYFSIKNNLKKEKNNRNIFGFFKHDINFEDCPILNRKENYKENHFFLETIYDKLYFIYLNYFTGFIEFYFIRELEEISKCLDLEFINENVNTLQFVDNLILVHNFDKNQTVVIDLRCKNENKILYKGYPISNYNILKQNNEKNENILKINIVESEIEDSNDDEYPNYKIKITYKYNETESMLSFNNTIFYTKNLNFSGSILEEYDPVSKKILNYYLIYFDPKIYFESSSSKYESLVNLTRRKNGKDTIINGLYELIKAQKNSLHIKYIFECIFSQIEKCKLTSNFTMNKIKMSKDKKLKTTALIEKIESYRESHELPTPLFYMFVQKKNFIVQSDLYYGLFKYFEYKNLNDSQINYILELYVYIYRLIKRLKMKVSPFYHKTLISFLKKIKTFDNENIFLQFHCFPDSLDLAYFLLYYVGACEKRYYCKTVRKHAFQNGIDMLYRLKKYEDIFEAYVRVNNFEEALKFIIKYNCKREKINKFIFERFVNMCKEKENIEEIYELLEATKNEENDE